MQVPASNLCPNCFHRLVRNGRTEIDEELPKQYPQLAPATMVRAPAGIIVQPGQFEADMLRNTTSRNPPAH
jgi:hypothetical protein